MEKRKLESSVRGNRAGVKGRSMKGCRIDFSDIPELTDDQLKSMRRVGRPPLGSATKLLIAVRVDPAILEALRKLAKKKGKGYQTLIHKVLEDYVEKEVA